MEYRYLTTSVAGFVQQLAVAYITHGYWFYVMGEIPEGKDPLAVDRKLIDKYDVAISKWARSRRKKLGLANVQYLRHERTFILIATRGEHRFFEEEAGTIRDVRRQAIQFRGYSIGYKLGVDRKWHASVRIAPATYRRIKERLLAFAVHASEEELAGEFRRLPFEPYAPVRRQLLNILRAVNGARRRAGFEPVAHSALRLRRRLVAPFSVGAEPAFAA